MKRRIIIGAGALVLVAGVAFVVWLRQPHPCRATFEKVREGMTLDEVCATVGGEPGDYTDGRSLAYFASSLGSGWRGVELEERRVWAAEDAFLSVIFYVGRVRTIDIQDPGLAPPTPLLDRLRARIGI